jgi:ABC-type multidrug transport system fused ATPase/permease subunit
MKNFLDSLNTMFIAARYSFAFCWRNAKKETLGRISVVIGLALVTFLQVQATGYTINSLQNIDGSLTSNLFGPIVLWALTLILSAFVGRGDWLFRMDWHQKLKYANQQEINNHRATLDVARFKSEEHDNLSRHIQDLPYGWDTRIWFSEVMLSVLSAVAHFFLFGATLAWYEPMYAVALLISAIPLVYAELGFQERIWNLTKELLPHHKKRQVLEKAYHGATAFIQALTFNQMPHLKKEIGENIDVVIHKAQHSRRISAKWELLAHLIIASVLFGVIVHAIWKTHASGVAVGTLAVLIGSAYTFYQSINGIIASLAAQWMNARGMILIEKDFMGMKPFIRTESPVEPRFVTPPTIRFNRVNFNYPGKKEVVLRDMSFTINSGAKVAIVGKSGSGKTTLLSLLMRHYDPVSGTIYIGETCLRNIEPRVWNKTITALTQDYVILERTLGKEIASSRLGDPLDLDRVRKSANLAHFDIVADAEEENYHTQIGTEHGGKDFSGGQKQRLALSRSLYPDSKIVVLDEPDARLDPESANKVMDNIFALTGITIILITHHVSHAERCDNIIVIEKGEVVEQGTHQELLEHGKAYASLYHKDKKRLG